MKTENLTREALKKYAAENREAFEALLKDFVEIPSISVDPTKKDAIRENAKLAADVIRRFGGEATILETDGHPIISGTWTKNPDWPTVTVYNHLDVQPASKETEPWATEPFTFTKQGDRYFGRGTTDDKGPALTALFGIKAALEADLPVNLRVLWEFEEEIGSPSFEKAIAAHAAELATDSVLVSDTIWIARGKPACPAGLRGLQGFLFTLETGETDQHSGVCGGAARNPMAELMKLVNECFDATTGRVKIPGFYDDVVPPTKKELEDFKRSGFTVAGFKKDHLFKSLRTSDPLDLMKRIWAQPTFEIHGMVGGYTGPGVKTVIPPRGEVKVSCRLVPNQTGEKIAKLVTKFVKSKNKDVVVHVKNRLDPYKGKTVGPLAEAVKRVDAVRLQARARLRPRGRLHRRRRHDGEGPEVPGHLPRPLAPRARLPRPERELRLGAGLRRHGGLHPLLRRGRLARQALEDRDARAARRGEAGGEEGSGARRPSPSKKAKPAKKEGKK